MPTISVPASSVQRKFYQCLFGDLRQPNGELYDEVGYGGARGGGKSWTSATAGAIICRKHPGAMGVLLRTHLKSAKLNLDSEIRNANDSLGLSRSVTYHVGDAKFTYANGSQLLFGYIRTADDFEKYQGLQLMFMGFEETNQMDPTGIISVIGSNRSGIAGGRAYRWFTFNPGGEAHDWTYERFVNPATRRKGTAFIQARVWDNPAMLMNDPDYVQRTLAGLPLWRRKQWLNGDWNAMAGQFWEIPPGQIREVEDYPRRVWWFAGVDYGRARPFAVVYCAYWSEWLKNPLTGRYDQVDRIHVANVIYERDLELDQQARLVLETEAAMGIDGQCVYYADPSTGRSLDGRRVSTGETIRQAWADSNFHVFPAVSNARVPGWALIKKYLRLGYMTFSPTGCQPLLSEMSKHVYCGSPGPPISEDLKEGPSIMDDATDALRYCIISMAGVKPPDQPLSYYEGGSQ